MYLASDGGENEEGALRRESAPNLQKLSLATNDGNLERWGFVSAEPERNGSRERTMQVREFVSMVLRMMRYAILAECELGRRWEGVFDSRLGTIVRCCFAEVVNQRSADEDVGNPARIASVD